MYDGSREFTGVVLPRESLRRRLLTLVVFVLVCALLVVGVRWVASALHTPKTMADFTGQKIAWEKCRTFECATLRVPLDYANIDGESLSLAISRVPAREPLRRIGSLVVNPGGPGPQGFWFVQQADDIFGSELLDRFDIIGFDPRGVGNSAPDCRVSERTAARYDRMDESPDNEDDRFALIDRDRVYAQACRKNGQGDQLKFFSTDLAARDLDILRSALGERELSFLGFSYGAFIGTSYAEQFPRRVGRMVLDGPIDPSLSTEEYLRSQLVGAEESFRSFVRRCAQAKTPCPLGSTEAEVASVIDRVIAHAAKAPLDDADDEPVTDDDIRWALLDALYSPDIWPEFAKSLAELDRGSADSFGELSTAMDDHGPEPDPTADPSASPPADPGLAAAGAELPWEQEWGDEVASWMAIQCLDWPMPQDQARLDKLEDDLTRISPMFGAGQFWSHRACVEWTTEAQHPHKVDAKGAKPILVLGTSGDPATPLGWAKSLVGQLDSGVLVERTGEGHTAYGRGNSCVDTAVEAYLTTGAVPARTRC